jgi:hypothetical protein
MVTLIRTSTTPGQATAPALSCLTTPVIESCATLLFCSANLYGRLYCVPRMVISRIE